HNVVGRLVAICLEEGIPLESLPIEKMQQVSPLIGDDVLEYLELDAVVDARNSLGGTATREVERQIKLAQEQLKREVAGWKSD
ncbi:MAG: argininosuccinate lyase, partial [Bacteroidetes bacterium]|nr:argininosuccinate lyase [Bacteroidota bacterium]